MQADLAKKALVVYQHLKYSPVFLDFMFPFVQDTKTHSPQKIISIYAYKPSQSRPERMQQTLSGFCSQSGTETRQIPQNLLKPSQSRSEHMQRNMSGFCAHM